MQIEVKGNYGGIAIRAWQLSTEDGLLPQQAWKRAVSERYSNPAQRKNALKHTCPKCAFLGLCQKGFVKGISPGVYTTSVESSGYALKAAALLKANHSLARDRKLLDSLVFVQRTPNDEVDVVVALWEHGLIN